MNKRSQTTTIKPMDTYPPLVGSSDLSLLNLRLGKKDWGSIKMPINRATIKITFRTQPIARRGRRAELWMGLVEFMWLSSLSIYGIAGHLDPGLRKGNRIGVRGVEVTR